MVTQIRHSNRVEQNRRGRSELATRRFPHTRGKPQVGRKGESYSYQGWKIQLSLAGRIKQGVGPRNREQTQRGRGEEEKEFFGRKPGGCGDANESPSDGHPPAAREGTFKKGTTQRGNGTHPDQKSLKTIDVNEGGKTGDTTQKIGISQNPSLSTREN